MQERWWRWRWRWRWCKRKAVLLCGPPYHHHHWPLCRPSPTPLSWSTELGRGQFHLPSTRCLLTLLVVLVLLLEWPRAAWAICPSKCICNEETLVVTCDRASLAVAPFTLNPAVRDLILSNNNIRMITAGFTFYKDLVNLDLTNNKLVNISNDSFNKQVNLQVLKLSNNQLSNISDSIFIGLRNLKVLQLDRNFIECLSDRIFVHLRSLQELDLSKNHISNIDPDTFHGLGSLRSLRLSDNNLTRVPASSWRPLMKLFHLDLGSNVFLTVDAHVFHTLSSLEELSLDSCNIKDLSPDAFAGLGNLRVLYLKDNMLTSVPTHAWEPLQRLEELYLGQNHFDEIRANAFAGLVRLRLLDIQGSQRLVVLRSSAFITNTDLKTVVLNHNLRLSTIEPRAFEGLPSLRHLSLREDGFQTLSEDLLAWDELETLDLRDNPFECNCSLLWLQRSLAARNLTLEPHGEAAFTPSLTTIRCQTPSSMRGRLLSELTESDLGCYFPNALQQAMIGIIGAAVVTSLVTLVLLGYKYRKRVTSVLKDKWTDGALRRKDLHYEKTNDEEENNILQAAQQSLKMTPVTEL